MPTRKIVNANTVFPAYIVRQLQQRLKGKGTLVYVPALTEQADPPHNLWMVHDLTKRGWSASRIAAHLKISARQVYRLRREAREHPARLAPKPPPPPAVYPPTEPAKPRKPSRAQLERRQREAEQARQARIFGAEPLTPPSGTEIIQVPRLRILPIERSDW
jgi:transposase-like protein